MTTHLRSQEREGQTEQKSQGHENLNNIIKVSKTVLVMIVSTAQLSHKKHSIFDYNNNTL